MSVLSDLLAENERKLLANDAATRTLLALNYKSVRTKLERDLKKLEQIVQEKGSLTPTQLLIQQNTQEILRQVEEEINRLSSQTVSKTQSAKTDAVNQAIDDVAKVAALKTSSPWANLDTKSAENIAARTRDGAPLVSTLKSLGGETVNRMRQELFFAAATGVNTDGLARRLATEMDVSFGRMQAIVRTEVLSAYRDTVLASYQENADIVAQWEWVCALSSRTCPVCIYLDGERFPLTTTQQASHVNCRCTSIPVFNDEKGKWDRELARDWFDKQGDDFQKKVLGNQNFEDFKAGRTRLRDYVQLDYDPTFGFSYNMANRTQALAAAAANKPIKKPGKGETKPIITPPPKPDPTPPKPDPTPPKPDPTPPKPDPTSLSRVPDTAKEQIKYLRDSGFDIVFDGPEDRIFADLDPKTFREAAKALAMLRSIDPDAIDFKVKLFSGDIQTIAQFSRHTGNRVLGINVKQLGNTSLGADGWLVSTEPAAFIIHEYAHAIHKDIDRANRGETDPYVALKVSQYAITRPSEFVAEVFTGHALGIKYSDDVWKEYAKWGGPKLLDPDDVKRRLAALDAPKPEPKPKPAPKWKPVMKPADADLWAKDSAISEPLYRGGSKTNSAAIRKNGYQVSSSNVSWGRVWGDGVYMTPHRELAENYSRGVVEKIRVNVKKPLEIDLRQGQYWDVYNGSEGIPRRLKEVMGEANYARAESAILSDRKAQITALEDQIVNEPDYYKRMEMYDKVISLKDHSSVYQQIAVDQGYDAFYIISKNATSIDAVGGTQLVIIDPKKVVIVDE